MKKNKVLIVSLLTLILLSCATTQTSIPETPTEIIPERPEIPLYTPPQWLSNTEAIYPTSQWLYAVEEGMSTTEATEKAINRLAQTLGVDLAQVTRANSDLAEITRNARANTMAVSLSQFDIATELPNIAIPERLMGLETETWLLPPTGTTHAIARINKSETATRYRIKIDENQRVIDMLLQKARTAPRTFEAVQLTSIAHKIAVVNDYDLAVLRAVDISAQDMQPSYQNAENLRTQAQTAQRAIVIHVKVDGDINGRINKAFTEYLNFRGFRTGAATVSQYILDATIILTEQDPNAQHKTINYTLNYTLKNQDGVELLAYSENGREGHNAINEARNRAVRAAERAISSTGFAVVFGEFIESLR